MPSIPVLSNIMGGSDPASSELAGNVPQASNAKVLQQRDEEIFYNSATAPRSLLGKWHYCCSCPGWNKATSKRFVYSRWDWTDTSCGCTCPSGRALDQFDSDIVVDMTAHQSCLQICRGEGDIVVFRLAGGDLSDSNETFFVTDVPHVYEVFSGLTFELAKMNLRDATAMGLGNRMGAVTRVHDARYGMEGTATTTGAGELVFYDSVKAKRTWIGRFFHLDCCLPPVYKITSERILYVEWDEYHPCDNPVTSCATCPCSVVSAILKDCCCGWGSAPDITANEAMRRRAENREKDKTRNCLNRNCIIPVGRTANFIDIDLVADVGAHQNLFQLPLNEGDLILHLMGGDASTANEGTGNKFYVKGVPEVFSLFDDFSYDLSNLDLTHFRQNAVTQEIMQR